MNPRWRYHRSRALAIAMMLTRLAFAGSFPEEHQNSAIAQNRASAIEPNEATKTRLQTIVKGILAAWDKADVICLGEDHGSKNDSDLRIALVEHPDFVRKVNVIIVECANVDHQDILDRFALEGEDMPREKLRAVWSDANGAEVWESPIYEAFLQETNRGRFIREAVSREILSKGLRGLAIYGAGHCECRGMGFPGELESKYPGRIWAAFSFYDVDEGRRVFGLGDEPELIAISATDKAKIPGGKMFFLRRYNDPATLGDIVNAIVYYGNARDIKVYPEKR